MQHCAKVFKKTNKHAENEDGQSKDKKRFPVQKIYFQRNEEFGEEHEQNFY